MQQLVAGYAMFFKGYWFVNSLHSTIIYCFIALFTISGNVMVGFAFWIDPFRQLKSVQNYFIINLAISDLLMGAVVEPLLVCTYWRESDNVFLAHYLFAIVSGASSLMNITALSAVRYVAVNKPFSHQTIVTRKTVLVSIAAIWLISLHFVVLVLAGWKSASYQLYLYGLGCFLPAVIILVAYTGVFRAIRKHTRTLKRIMDTGRGLALRNAVRAEKATTTTVLMVLAVFLIFWVPFLTVDLIMVQWPNSRSDNFHFVRDIALTLTYFSSGVNPVLYTWRVRQFRRALLKILGCKKHRSLRRESRRTLSAQTASTYFSFIGRSTRYVVRHDLGIGS